MKSTPLLLSLASLLTTQVAFAATPAVEHALLAFSAWDADQDSRLSLAELDLAIASPHVTGERAASAVALRRVAQNKNSPLAFFTRESIHATATETRFVDSRDDEEDSGISARDSRTNFERYYASALRKIESSPRQLFVGPLRLEGFIQGRVGSCFSLAPLTALALAEPEALRARFTISPASGEITFTFGQDLAVTVPALTDGEIALATVTGDGGLWAAAYEKAVGELRRRSFSASSPRASATPFATVTRGGSAGTMLGVLTGRAITRFSCRDWLPTSTTPPSALPAKLDNLRVALRTASEERRLMTAGTSAKTRKVPSLSQNHAYAVLGYDPATDLVTLRDPHGQNFTPKGAPGLTHGYAVRHGIFHVPVPEVVHLMAGFAFQLDRVVAHQSYPASSSSDTPASAP